MPNPKPNPQKNKIIKLFKQLIYLFCNINI